MLVGCGGGETNTAVNVPPPVTSAADAAVIAPAPISFDACRAAIAKRFHPPASWSKPVTAGPKDRTPYSDCTGWIDGQPAPKAPVSLDACHDSRGGWAGIGMVMSSFGFAISDDGTKMMRCKDACTVFQVADGKVLDRTKAEGVDGNKVTSRPAIVALMKKHGLNNGTQKLSIDDATLDWSFSSTGSAITWHLRDTKSATDLVIGRIAHSDKYVFPSSWMLSTNGRLLVLMSENRFEGQGLEFEDQAVDFPAAVALMYVDAATADPLLADRAKAACDKL